MCDKCDKIVYEAGVNYFKTLGNNLPGNNE
jgi:hypothetical protein